MIKKSPGCLSMLLRLFLLSSLLVILVACQSPTPSLPPADACGNYGGDNSTCHCDSTRKKAWVTFGLDLFFTPVGVFAVMRWFVFTDISMPFLGLIKHHAFVGSYAQEVTSTLWWSALFWTALGTFASWLAIALRYALDLWSNDFEICTNLNRFIWYSWLFWLLPLMVSLRSR